MSINFVAIDFETANQKRESACSVGLTKVLDGKIVDSFYTLINPEDDFSPFNIAIHGITSDQVISAPNYFDVVNEIIDFIDELPLVAHYAPFDVSVIRNSNDRYGVNNFHAKYFDSHYLSKKYISSISYKLSFLSDMIGVEYNHHNALEDSKACAELILYLCRENNCSDIDSLLDGAGYSKMGTIQNTVGSNFGKSKSYTTIDINEIIDSIDKSSLDQLHPFYDKHACFTGKLTSMIRREAMTIFASYGGIPEKGVNKKVNYLIMGEQDFKIVGDDLKSSKIIKAEKLLSEGQDIQLLTEDDFLRMI